MTSDEFIDRIGVGPETDICALENVYRHLVATGANIGDVLRGEVAPMWLVMSNGDGTERGMTTTHAEERLKRDLSGRRMAVQALLSQEFGYYAAQSIAEFIWYRSEPKPDLSELRALAKQMDTMGYQSAAWPESQEAYAWCAGELTAALDRLESATPPKPELEKLRDAAEATYRAGGGSYYEGKVDAFNQAIDRLEGK